MSIVFGNVSPSLILETCHRHSFWKRVTVTQYGKFLLQKVLFGDMIKKYEYIISPKGNRGVKVFG